MLPAFLETYPRRKAPDPDGADDGPSGVASTEKEADI